MLPDPAIPPLVPLPLAEPAEPVLMPGLVAMPLPVVGELDGRVPVLFDALLPDGPQGLLVPDWPLVPELPGVADGELLDPGALPPPAAPPACANAKPGLPAIKAAVRIARVRFFVIIICSLGDEPLGRNAKRRSMFLWNSESSSLLETELVKTKSPDFRPAILHVGKIFI